MTCVTGSQVNNLDGVGKCSAGESFEPLQKGSGPGCEVLSCHLVLASLEHPLGFFLLFCILPGRSRKIEKMGLQAGDLTW